MPMLPVTTAAFSQVIITTKLPMGRSPTCPATIRSNCGLLRKICVVSLNV